MPAVATLVYQTTEDNGTGNLGLTAVNGYQSFADAFPSGTTSDSFDYFISNRSSPEWERGTGHWSGASLVRDTVLESSNSNSPVAFTTGIKDITNDVPASKQVQTDLAQTLTNKTIDAGDNTITGLTKSDVGLGNVDNTSDANKPVSTATQTALDLKADIADLASYLDKTTYDPNAVGGDVFDQDNMVDGTTNKNYTATEKTKLAGIEALADVTDAANVAAAGAFMKSSDDADDITEGASHLFLTTSERSAISGLASTYQPLDSDLTAIAGLSPTNDDIVQRKAGAWTNSSMAQLATDLNLAATYQPLDSDLTSWAGVTRASGFDTFAATPSSANLRSLVTDETGSGGSLVFATGPTVTGLLGSAASSFTATTQSARDNSTKLATTAYVDGTTREKLTGSRTYYVRADGSDSNTGLVDSSGGAFLTIQKAIDVCLGNLDFGGNSVTIQVRSGTYTGAVSLSAPPVGKGTLSLVGDTGTPSNVVLNVTGTALTMDGFSRLSMGGFKIVASVHGIVLQGPSQLTITGAMDFGAITNIGIYALKQGFVQINASYTVSGSGQVHYFADQGGLISLSGSLTVTISGTPAFSIAFAQATGGQILASGDTYSGSATGKRYNVTLGGVINTGGGGANYFPGNSAGTGGTTTGGGVYS